MDNSFLAMPDDDFLKSQSSVDSVANSTPPEVAPEPSHEIAGSVPYQQEEAPQIEQQYQQEEAAPQETLEDLYQPFKANGKDFQVRSLDEARTLMQMGANYTAKMQALAPNLRYMKTLEKEGLLNEEKLNYLIDLSKNNPAAIAKAMKDAELDTYSLEEQGEYSAQNHMVSEQSVQLDQVLDSIESTETYNRCIDIVGNKWDGASRAELANNPQLIAQINEQMQIGVFDKIAEEVERIKIFGGLSGMSDFEAYKQVGSQMYHRGDFANLVPAQQQQQQPPVQQNVPPPPPVARTQVQQPIPSQVDMARQAAALPQHQLQRQKQQNQFNPLAMSDEEFMRIYNINV